MKAMPKLMGVLLLAAGSAWAANPPHIGYSYPAGGQQGSSFRMMIGGQYLLGSTNVLVSGEGVEAGIVQYSIKYEPRRLRQLIRRKSDLETNMEGKEGGELEKLKRQIAQIEKQIAVAELPPGIDITNRKQASKYYQGNSREQFNPQIAGRLRLDVKVAADAPPGERELRIQTAGGLSDPIYFQVGTLAEVQETEPNDDHMSPELQLVQVPSVINGQILPGDIDHFRFKALKGQSIVVDVGARKIIPYLADAVPGWFQAIVALYDEEGNEVAYRDDYKFNPDPVLFFDVPDAGTYTLSIKDSIYRGREDFVYRIAVGELPFITGIFPLGAGQGDDVEIELSGKNLPKERLSGNLSQKAGSIRYVSVEKKGYRSNQMPFAIGDLPEIFEAEPNNAPAEAQAVETPLVVNGRIGEAGDTDYFSFQGEQGQKVVIRVSARRLNSPLDSTVELSGPGIETPVRNDDYVDKDAHLHLGAGLVTHHADSYLLHTLPATGTYIVRIGDTQAKGSPEHAYRLRIGPARPGFQLRMEPSGLQIAPGGTAAFTVRALRTDGFDGAIALSVENLPDGYEMSAATIPAGSNTARFTITAPKQKTKEAVSPEVRGVAEIGGQTVSRPAVPVDDQMQAFLYRHLVPARELVLAPVSAPEPLVFEVRLPASGIIELPLGEEIRIPFNGRIRPGLRGAGLVLDNPPEGLGVVKGWVGHKRAKGKTADGEPRFEKNIAAGQITLKAEAPLKPGDTMNVIVVAVVRRGREQTRHIAPAFPVRITEPRSK